MKIFIIKGYVFCATKRSVTTSHTTMSATENMNGETGSGSEVHKVSDDQVERALSDEIHEPVPMTFKRLLSLGALAALSAVAILPLFLVGGALCSALSYYR